MLIESKNDEPEKVGNGFNTVQDLLTQSDVNETIENVVEIKDEIDEILIIYTKKDDDNIQWSASELTYSRCNWLMDVVKNALLNEGS